ncbi:MAG: sel1 repeat family protein [Clostridia bacterium]|nr:sel1 repeat family protein [Clostridia bacterium]
MENIRTLFDSGDSEELVRLGTELFRRGEEEKAFECYRLACKLGNVTAMGNLGFCYQNGRGVKADNRLAAYCFERASELDDPGSMLKLGDFHFHGKGGLAKDRSKAVGLYLRAYEIAAAKSEPDERLLAQLCYRLGSCKKDGLGTEQNFEDAYEYFQATAEAVASDAEYGDLQAESLLRKAEAGMAECELHF